MVNLSCKKCRQIARPEDVYCRGCGTALGSETQMAKETPDTKGNAQPLSLGDYLLIGLLLTIPVVNIVVLLLWALDTNANINRKNLARAALIYMGIATVLTVILGIGLYRAMLLDGHYFEDVMPYYNEDMFEYYIGDPEFDEWVDFPFDSNEI